MTLSRQVRSAVKLNGVVLGWANHRANRLVDLASHYDRAEFVAGEMLEVIANDRAAAMHAADQVETAGSVFVCADLLALFFAECDHRNIHVISTAAGVDDLGRMLTRYDLVKDDDPA